MQEKRKLNLAAWIIIGMLAGIAVGFVFLKVGGTFTTDYLKPVGTIYINLLKFMVQKSLVKQNRVNAANVDIYFYPCEPAQEIIRRGM